MDKMRRKFPYMVLICAVAVLSATGAFGIESKPADWPEEIRIGFIPSLGEEALDYFTPVIDHLRKHMDVKVTAVSANDYSEIIRAMSYKQLEFAYLGPKSYVEASERANAEALVSELNADGEPGYYGVFIAKKGSGIESFDDAKGKTFAFTDPNSTSGYLVPMVMFKAGLGIDPKEYFKSITFSGSHADSIQKVAAGEIDVAATNTLDLRRMDEKGVVSKDDFTILEKSDLIPGAPYSARKDLPQSLKQRFREVMLRFNENTEALKKMQFGGFVVADDGRYDIVRELMRVKDEAAKK